MLNKKVFVSLIVLLGLVVSTLKAQMTIYYTDENGKTQRDFISQNDIFLKGTEVSFNLEEQEEQYDILARGKIHITGKIIAIDDDSILINQVKENKLLKIAKNDIIKYEPFFKKKYAKLLNPSHSKVRYAIINHKNFIRSISCTDLKFINDTTFTCKVDGLKTNYTLSEVNSIFIQDEHPVLLALNCINLGGMIYTLGYMLADYTLPPVGVYFMVSSLVGVLASLNILNQPMYKKCTIIYNDSSNIVSTADYEGTVKMQMFKYINKNIWDIINNVDNEYGIACKSNSIDGYSLFFNKYSSLFIKYPPSINKFKSARNSCVKLYKIRFKSLNLSSLKVLDLVRSLNKEGLTRTLVQVGFSNRNDLNRLVFDVSFYGEKICQFVIESKGLGIYSNSSVIKSIAFFD